MAGHLYGQPYEGTILPTTSFLLNIDKINNDKQAKMMIFLGDIVCTESTYAFNLFQETVADKMGVPIYNAVGNHDLNYNQASPLYLDLYGKETFYFFDLGMSRFIFLDTELDRGNISGKREN